MRASSSSRGTSRPTTSVGWRVSPLQSGSPPGGATRRARRARARGRRAGGRSGGRGRRVGVALGEQRVRALGAETVVERAPSARARPAAGAGGSVELGRARRGGTGRCRRRRPASARLRAASSIASCARRWYSATDASCVERPDRRRAASAAGWSVRIGEAAVDAAPSRRRRASPGSRVAIASATAVLPDAVGPKIASTRPGGSDASTPSSGGAPGPLERRRRRAPARARR